MSAGESRAQTFRYDAFLSYRHCEPDRGFARDLLQTLESARLRVAIDDRDFDPQSTFLEEMERCIRESRFTVAVVSTRYLESANTREEAIIRKVLDLQERQRRLIPILLEAVERPVWMYDIVGINFAEADPIVSPSNKLLLALGVQPRDAADLLTMEPGQLVGDTLGLTRALDRAQESRGGVRGKKFSVSNQLLRLQQARPEPTLVARGLVCAKLTASGFLDLELPTDPYAETYDPTDQNDSTCPRRVFAALYLPSIERIRAPTPSAIPATAICTVDPELVLSRIQQVSKRAVTLLSEKPRLMGDAAKEELIHALGHGLRESFVAAVTIPSIVLGIGRRKPELAYHAILDLFLFPLLEMHRRIGFDEFSLWLPEIDNAQIKKEDAILKIAKQGVRTLFPNRRNKVDLVSNNQFWHTFAKMAKFLTWVINYSGDKDWFPLLRERFEADRLD